MEETLNINSQIISGAADASTDIYNFAYWRKVDQFRLAAAVRFAPDGKSAFVVIRGMSLVGNWLFTNFQAHFDSFNPRLKGM